MSPFDKLVATIDRFLETGMWDARSDQPENFWRMHAYGMMMALSVLIEVGDRRHTDEYDRLWRRIDAKFNPSWLEPATEEEEES